MRKSTTGPWSAGTRLRVPTHSTETTVLPARSAAWPMWSAWRMPVVAKLVELLKLPSPVRWKVLFVEPCSPGQVPVESVYQPTPVFGGKPWSRPFWPLTPSRMSCLHRRHGALPGVPVDEVGPHAVGGEEDDGVAGRRAVGFFLAERSPAAPADTEPATSRANESVRAARSAGRNRNVRVIGLLSPG